jgi:hypothetical protein
MYVNPTGPSIRQTHAYDAYSEVPTPEHRITVGHQSFAVHLAWLTGQIDTWSGQKDTSFLNMCLQILDTIGFVTMQSVLL